MKKLSRFELAAVKRTAANVKTMRAKKAKLQEKIMTLKEELDTIESSIEAWEAPIKLLTDGYTSEQVLNGEMEISTSLEETPTEDTSGNEVPPEDPCYIQGLVALGESKE